MVIHKTKSAIKWFTTNKNNELKVLQLPSILLWTWIAFVVINHLIYSIPTLLLQNMVLFTWAYLELKDGESYFRNTLGLIIIVSIILNLYR